MLLNSQAKLTILSHCRLDVIKVTQLIGKQACTGSRNVVSPFRSGHWINSWLSVPEVLKFATAIEVLQGDHQIGVSFFGRRIALDGGFVPLRIFSAFECGNAEFDVLAPEYSPFLTSDELERQVSEKTITYLFEVQHADRITLPAIEILLYDSLVALARQKGWHTDITNSSETYWIDLEKVRSNGGDLVACVGSSTRANIRKGLAKLGPLSVSRASSKAQAFEFLKELERLHQSRWEGRGHAGAFGPPRFLQNLTSLIESDTDFQFVDLVRINTPTYPLGYLLNFKVDGCVFNYVSGIDFRDSKLHPGLLVHVAFVHHLASTQAIRYDFMAGENQQKKSLSTHSARLVWIRLERKNLRTSLCRLLRSCKRLIPRTSLPNE